MTFNLARWIGIAGACLLSGHALADGAVVSTNPPAYQNGNNSLSQTPTGGLRVQLQSNGQDVGPTTGFPLVNTVTPFTVTTSSTSVTGLTLPGKVRFQASPVSTLGGSTGNTVSIQVSYSGGNACTSPNVILGPGQIDDWVYIPGSTAPTACAASAGGILLAVQ